MIRKAFLLGFLSIGGQVLLLRELVASFNGDELFISTALFGWLVSVAVGASLGGRKRLKVSPGVLFLIGIVLLPVTITAVRLCPLIIGDVIGEVIPFSTAAIFSILAMIPLGVISGWLFPAITREGHRPAASIVQVYLFEGIGAFIGGVAVAALIGFVYFTLGMALALCTTVIGFYGLPRTVKGAVVRAGLVLVVLVAFWGFAPAVDYALEQVKYSSYEIDRTFDTHYGRQSLLSRGDATLLLTDNTLEATYPNLIRAENVLIPPLILKPEAKSILYIGRAEFGVMQLADSIPDLKITALDPRQSLSSAIDDLIPFDATILRTHDDQLSFFTRQNVLCKYDIIILDPGEPDNYKNGRLLTDRFLRTARLLLAANGILYFPSSYDSDRYISQEKKELLSVVHNTLAQAFDHVAAWPGEMTLFFGSDDPIVNLPPDSVLARVGNLSFDPQYINETYLSDRLAEMKLARLEGAFRYADNINSIDRPVMPFLQAIFRTKATGFDRRLISFLFRNSLWVTVIPILILALFGAVVFRRQRRRAFGLFLYFTAGATSLSLELISFYVYQSSAGSLYSEIAALIGVFMLGLALGTYYSYRAGRENLEFPALLLLLTAGLVFLATFDRISPGATIFYHMLFLFTVALATGSLFVAATYRYYFGKADANRGTGYAFEIVGSALGALVATTFVLPIIGLQWLLVAIVALTVLALIGAILTASG